MSKKEERLRQLEELKQKREEVNNQLQSIINFKQLVQFPSLTGRTVKNKKFGEGVIGESEGQYFSVQFASGIKKYAFPDSFAKGFLEIDDEGLVNSCKKYGELLEKEEALIADLKKIDSQIAGIQI